MTLDVEEIAGYWTYLLSSDHSKSSDPDVGEIVLQLATRDWSLEIDGLNKENKPYQCLFDDGQECPSSTGHG
jgi:hypothetical protein